jgi:hypothetical protein
MRLKTELILEQVRLGKVTIAPTKEEPIVTLPFRAALTRDVAEAFGCRDLIFAGDVPRSGVDTMTLEGDEVDCEVHFQHDSIAWSCVASEVGSYQAKLEGDGPKLIFRVKVKGYAATAAEMVEKIKHDPLTVTLKPCQMDLGLQEAQTDSDTAGEDDDSERLISKEQADDTAAAADEPGDAAPLASVIQMGGSHQRGGKGRRRRGGADPEPPFEAAEEGGEADILTEMGMGTERVQ